MYFGKVEKSSGCLGAARFLRLRLFFAESGNNGRTDDTDESGLKRILIQPSV